MFDLILDCPVCGNRMSKIDIPSIRIIDYNCEQSPYNCPYTQSVEINYDGYVKITYLNVDGFMFIYNTDAGIGSIKILEHAKDERLSHKQVFDGEINKISYGDVKELIAYAKDLISKIRNNDCLI